MAELLSRTIERSDNAAAHPLVKPYTRRRLRQLFTAFTRISTVQRQMEIRAVPKALHFLSSDAVGAVMGWNLIIKAHKPRP
jgi:hypothetical protein